MTSIQKIYAAVLSSRLLGTLNYMMKAKHT